MSTDLSYSNHLNINNEWRKPKKGACRKFCSEKAIVGQLLK